MSLHALVENRDELRPTVIPSAPTTEEVTAVMTALTSHSPLTSSDTALSRLERLPDEVAVDSLLTSFLARRRAVRRARREIAIQQARHEHELLMQRALLGTCLAHLR